MYHAVHLQNYINFIQLMLWWLHYRVKCDFNLWLSQVVRHSFWKRLRVLTMPRLLSDSHEMHELRYCILYTLNASHLEMSFKCIYVNVDVTVQHKMFHQTHSLITSINYSCIKIASNINAHIHPLALPVQSPICNTLTINTVV